jgi:hypothetical protein
MSDVFEMEEYDFKRQENVGKDKAHLKFENANISWGF